MIALTKHNHSIQLMSVGKRAHTQNTKRKALHIMWIVIHHRFWLTWPQTGCFKDKREREREGETNKCNAIKTIQKWYANSHFTFQISHISHISHIALTTKWNISFQIIILYLSLLAGLTTIIMTIIWQMAWFIPIPNMYPFGLLCIRIIRDLNIKFIFNV